MVMMAAMKASAYRSLPILVIFCLAVGYLAGQWFPLSGLIVTPPLASSAFHDLRINQTDDYVRLIDIDQPDIVRLASRFTSVEEAYRFVSTEISFAPFAPPGPVDKTLSYKTGSCLGKAALLASIYRAMGIPSKDVRLMMGVVDTGQGLADHVWIDMEHQGKCLQQDPSGMLGQFGFDEFPGNRYTQRYVVKETLCFNDQELAIVSQLNRYRNGVAANY